MEKNQDSWTREHDLALLFLGLAYGTDQNLTESELNTITHTLGEWLDDPEDVKVKEIVLEAFSIYLEGDLPSELTSSIQSLQKTLTKTDQKRVLEQLVRIAGADGILLSSEQSLIALIADQWGLKETPQERLRASQAEAEGDGGWSVLHNIALLYLIIAHSADNRLTDSEIREIISRLSEWQPDLSEEEIRNIAREALQRYATNLNEKEIRHAIEAIKKTLSVEQRHKIINDLRAISEVDGPVNTHATSMIDSLLKSWEIETRI
jgi:uncharacterized tellurite resistance protein B-like protein